MDAGNALTGCVVRGLWDKEKGLLVAVGYAIVVAGAWGIDGSGCVSFPSYFAEATPKPFGMAYLHQ